MTTATLPRRPGARARLLEAAEHLFYAEGIHAVGVDRLCAEAGVSKRSLYQHFSGKDDVVTAMLEARAAQMRERLVQQDPGQDRTPRERIIAVFDDLDHAAESAGDHGCPFVAAATEIKDRDHPGVQVARQQKLALTSYFSTALRDGGATEPDALAAQLTLIFDGAAAHSVVQGGSTPATRQAVETLLHVHGM